VASRPGRRLAFLGKKKDLAEPLSREELMLVLPLAYVTIPSIYGKPIFVWGGILLGILLVFQLLTGLRVIKVPTSVHRWNGISIFTVATAHAVMGLMVWFDGWIY
jgi:hypothetical protein